MPMSAREIASCALFIALVALGARINFPLPFGNYYSLQFLFVLLAGIILGPRYAPLSLGLYLVLGLAGFPFFATGGGISYVMKPTFGFLLGFVAAAFVTGLLSRKFMIKSGSRRRYLVAAFGGLVVTYGFGIFYMYIANRFFLGLNVPFWTLFLACFPVDIPCDLMLCVVAALLGMRLMKEATV